MCVHGNATEPTSSGCTSSACARPDAARDQSRVGVHHALGRGGRAGRGVEPPHRVAVGRRRRQGRRIAFGQAAVLDLGADDERLERAARRLLQTTSHRLVVEVAPHPGHGEELHPRLLQHRTDLALAVDRDDGHLRGTEAGQRERQDDRLDARRQLPRHRCVGRDAQAQQAGGHALAPVAELSEADRAVGLVDEHRRRQGSPGRAGRAVPRGWWRRRSRA